MASVTKARNLLAYCSGSTVEIPEIKIILILMLNKLPINEIRRENQDSELIEI